MANYGSEVKPFSGSNRGHPVSPKNSGSKTEATPSLQCEPMKGFAIILRPRQPAAACALPFGVYPNIEDRSDIEDWTHVPRYEKTALSPEELAARMEEWHAPMVTHNIAATSHARGCTPARAARNAYPATAVGRGTSREHAAQVLGSMRLRSTRQPGGVTCCA